MINILFRKLILTSILFSSIVIAADKSDKIEVADKQQVYQLLYIEREPGVDDYEIAMLVSERYIRIDEAGEESGFIVYDDKDKTIYSVSHVDKSVLVIKEHKFSLDDSPVKADTEYLELADAPLVSGEKIFNYRVFVNDAKQQGAEEITCTEVQLVENLLPDVRKMLRNYQKVVTGQQVKMVDNRITDIQTPCFYADQIYNTGAYYEKGLPIQEWHSNERSKILTSYKEISVDKNKFTIPEKYRQFSVDNQSKTFLE